MVQALNLENEPWPEDVCSIAARVMPIVFDTIPFHTVSRMDAVVRWEGIQDAGASSLLEILKTMLFVTRALCLEYGQLELEQCRQNVCRHATGFHPNAFSAAIEEATHTRYTEEWLQRVLHTCSSSEVSSIAAGDPYAPLC